jgi:hypothetical protein
VLLSPSPFLKKLVLMSEKPRISEDPLYMLLRDGGQDDFNQRRATGANCDLVGVNLVGVDLRGANLKGLDMSGAYLRGADLRGLDLRETNLLGASLAQAHVSGTFFPTEIAASEIMMSVQYGTRIRYRPHDD